MHWEISIAAPRQVSKQTNSRWTVTNRAVSTPFDSTHAFRFPSGVRPGYRPFLVYIVIGFINLAATFGATGRAYSRADAPNTLGSGTKLYLRLENVVSTKSSHLHQSVTAQVVREVTGDQGVLIPLGAEVTGKIERLIPSSTPTDHARLRIDFTQLAIPGHPTLSLTGHLTEVENARETVLPDGTIQGVLDKDAPIGRIDDVLDRLGSVGTQMEKMGGKTFGKIDTSIDFPAGADLVLTLDQPLAVDSTSPPAATLISPPLAGVVQKLLLDAPHRAQSKSKKPGDPLNLAVVGTSDQVLRAFRLSGWSEARKLERKSAEGTARAVWDNAGYGEAPVSQLYLYGRAEDLAFEKMLNTFMKRHHLRLWRTAATTANGRDVWMGASTHDIGLDVHLGVISHAIDPNLDAERNKVGADLLAGGLVAAEQLVTRPNPLSEGKTATGGTWKTDGQLLVIELKNSGPM